MHGPDHPSNLIYDLIIEDKYPPYNRLCAYIKFEHSQGYGYRPKLISITTTNGQPLPTPTSIISINDINNALQSLYWAMNNDPEPPSQEVLEFFHQLRL